MSKFYVCRCFYTKNIFVKELKLHVEYLHREQFLRNYNKILQDKGITELNHQESLIADIEKEIVRRKRLGLDYIERKKLIATSYVRLHPDIYKLQKEFLHSNFIDLVDYCTQNDATFEGIFNFLHETNAERVYTFPVFTEDFYKLFLEEIRNFEQSDCPKDRPNTMNKYGVLLEEMGFGEFFSDLRDQYLQPVTKILFPDCGGGSLDSHKAFIVEYRLGEDTKLDYHYDNAEITINIALSEESSFMGGNLYFGSMKDVGVGKEQFSECGHKTAFGLIHRGLHRHGAMPITQGERYNLIIWMRASCIRNKVCPMCNNTPDLEETVGFGDGFTKSETVNVCTVY